VQSLYKNTTGAENVALGYECLHDNTTATWNTAVGYQAGNKATTGGRNTYLGHQAAYWNSTGTHNTAIGMYAMGANIDGTNNTTLGYAAGDNITTGSSNIIIGSGVDAPSATGSNQLNIGNVYYGDSSTKKAMFKSSSVAGVCMNVMNPGTFSLADDSSTTIAVEGTGSLIAIQQTHTGNQYAGALFHGNYSPAGSTTELSDPKNYFANSDIDGQVCVYISGYTNNVTIKNRSGFTKSFSVQIIAFSGV